VTTVKGLAPSGDTALQPPHTTRSDPWLTETFDLPLSTAILTVRFLYAQSSHNPKQGHRETHKERGSIPLKGIEAYRVDRASVPEKIQDLA